MSPTLLEITVGVIAAVLVFLFAVRAVPIVIEQLSYYFDRSFTEEQDEKEKESEHYER